ncbi:MAG: hypothetical protein WDN04_16130 [Rhodospirillales bacterium]
MRGRVGGAGAAGGRGWEALRQARICARWERNHREWGRNALETFGNNNWHAP